MDKILHLFKQSLASRESLMQLAYHYAATVVSALGGLIVVIVLANTLDRSDYGAYKYVFSVVGVLTVLSFTGGFRNLAVQTSAKGLDGFVPYLFKMNFLYSVPMLFGGIGVGLYYLINDAHFLGNAIMLATGAAILGNNGIIAYGYLNGRRLYKHLLFMQVIQSALAALVVSTAALLSYDLMVVLAASVLTPAFTFTAFYYFIRRNLLRNDLADTTIAHYGKHLSALSILTTILMHIDSILIFKVLGAEALALYALATPFVDRIIGFSKATYYYALPKFTGEGYVRARTHLYKRSLLIFSLGLGIFAAYYFTAPALFRLLFPEYMASVGLSQLFALNIPIIALSILPDAYLDSLFEIKNKYIVKATTSISRIALMLLLIHPLGIAGVIISELVARVFGTIATLLLIRRYLRRNARAEQ